MQLWSLAGELAGLVGCPVDLLDLRAASTVMQYQVLTTGSRLWGTDPEAGLFECFVLSEKLAFDESRAGLLADALKKVIGCLSHARGGTRSGCAARAGRPWAVVLSAA